MEPRTLKDFLRECENDIKPERRLAMKNQKTKGMLTFIKFIGALIRIGSLTLWIIALWKVASALGLVGVKWMLIIAIVGTYIGALIMMAVEQITKDYSNDV